MPVNATAALKKIHLKVIITLTFFDVFYNNNNNLTTEYPLLIYLCAAQRSII